MKNISKLLIAFSFALPLGAIQYLAPEAMAQSSYFTSRGCVDCHSAPTASTCAGCHEHSGTLTATKNKTTSYAPGETVTITLTASGARSGWIGVRLYDQGGAEIARSSGNQSGMGGSAVYPAVLSAPAPAAAGTYTWRMAYLGNQNGTGSGDVHAEKSVNVSITVASAAPPADTAAPVVTFTLPATATSLTVPVSALSATDNVAVTGYLVNKVATPPAATAAGWTAAAPTSVTAVAGSNTFYAWAKDAAGNVSAVKSATVVVTLPDTTVPVVSAFTLPATATSLTVPVSSFTATDNVGVSGYLINKSATAPAASATGWTATAPTSVTAVAGSNTFYAWAKDAAGNVSLSRSAVVTVTLPDTTVPVVSAFTLPATATSLTVPVISLTASDNVGVSGYLINKSATAPAASATGWTATAPTSVTAVAGSNTFYAWAKDAAGNVSLSRSAVVTVTLPPAADTTLPVVSAFSLPATSASLTVPVLAFTATDNVGVNAYLITKSPAVPTSGWLAAPSTSVTAVEGSNTFYAWARDAAGNISLSRSASVTVTLPPAADTTKPTLTISALANGSLTNKATLNISGSASDAGGLQAVTVNGEPVIVNADGSFSSALTLVAGANVITVIATDKAGNQTSDSRSITYDASAPVLTIASPADNSTTTQSFITLTGSISETSTVSFSVNGGSPQSAAISGSSYSATAYLAAGVNTITITATDLAGNIATAKRTITFSNTSNSLGLAVISPSQDITTRYPYLVLKGKVSDDDDDDVTVKITMNGRTYTPRVDDGEFRQRLYFTTPKLYAITVTATDDAGNSSSITRNVIYRPAFSGDRDERDDD